MAYKSLLTVLTRRDGMAELLTCAVTLARREDAHLDVLCLGVDQTQAGYYYAGATIMLQQDLIDHATTQAKELEAQARDVLRDADIRWSAESAVAQIGGIATLVAVHARFSDLVILPLPYGENCGQADEAVIESAMFDGQAPVLVVPAMGAGTPLGRHIVVAWNQSTEALTAVRRAIPMLKAAETVNIVVIDPPQHGPESSEPGARLSRMLSRHGVNAEISVLAKTRSPVSESLKGHLRDQKADMLVMGAYGHSRFREAILGGATRAMLEGAEVPVFMAH